MESPEARLQPSMATPTKENTRPKVLIRGEWRKVHDGYPVDASGQLERDQLFINDLAKQLVAELRTACQLTPISWCKAPVQRHKNGLDLQACILQLLVAGACFVGCIFLRPFGVPNPERIRLLLYWLHAIALVAHNGGTSVGHGPVRTLFLEPDFVPSAGTLDVGHGPVRTLFLGLILCLVQMTPCETMLYWPSPN